MFSCSRWMKIALKVKCKFEKYFCVSDIRTFVTPSDCTKRHYSVYVKKQSKHAYTYTKSQWPCVGVAYKTVTVAVAHDVMVPV